MILEELEAFRKRRDNRNDGDSGGEERDEDSRTGDNHWCSCGCCVALPTSKESICCKGLRKARDTMGEITCITRHPAFERVCLDSEVLQTALVAIAYVHFHHYSVPIQNTTYRLAAYRQFTNWIHTRLGRAVRRVTPACAVNQIRLAYPKPSGQYT